MSVLEVKDLRVSFGGKEVVVVMQKTAAAPHFEYRLLATNKTSTMQKELQDAADAGFEFVGQTVFEVCGFVRTSLATDVPDLQLHVLPWAYPSPNQDAPIRHEVDTRAALTIMSSLTKPAIRVEPSARPSFTRPSRPGCRPSPAWITRMMIPRIWKLKMNSCY